ncbi:hypothetical protein [Lysinibacillus sp. NPDC056185]|uniref:hypothetical protein n=1 Tax=Lysinibacillus sp. NPDC056185 TaxID=3345739 RepID=UPI0039EDEBB0
MRFPAGETVTVLRANLVTDRYGNEVWDWSDPDRTLVPGCAVAPRRTGAAEVTDLGRQGVIVGLTVYAPAGTDIRPSDRMEVGGRVYEVDGESGTWASPFTGWAPGIEVALKQMEG